MALLEQFFNAKRILVTGACRGIGRVMTERMTKYGAEVWALSNESADLAKLKQDLPGVQTVCCDLGDWSQTEREIKKLHTLHCLVNNAGVDSASTFSSLRPEELDWMMSVNVKGPLNVSQIVSSKMIEAGIKGSIVNISSEVSTKVQLRNVGYSLSKASLSMLTRVMAFDLARNGIRVNEVRPGSVQTTLLAKGCDAWFGTQNGEGLKILENTLLKRKRIPTGKVYIEIDEIVNTTLFLLSDLAPQMIGQSILVDAGQHLT